MCKVHVKEAAKSLGIMNFLDYKEFLAELLGDLKKRIKGYSHMQFAEDLGFSRSNVIWLVITGRRKLTSMTSRRLIEALGLCGLERRYFTALVLHNNTRDHNERERHVAQLMALKREQLPTAREQQQLEYYAEWYYPLIREMIGMKEFKADPTWIASRIYGKLLPREILATLELLQNLELIAPDPQGERLVQTGGQVRIHQLIGKMAAVRYHEKMLEIAQESITRVPAERRDYNVLTLCMSDDTALRLKELVRVFCESVLALEQENMEDADQVFQLNLQLFPFTRKETVKKGG